MRREIELKRRLRSMKALGQAVGALKSLSAHHFRHARQTVEPARIYRDGVGRILEGSGVSFPSGDGAAGLLVVGAELALCGGYNTQMVEAGLRCRAELGAGPTFCVGHRAHILLGRRGIELQRTYHGPTSVEGLASLLLKLAEDVLTSFASENLASFDIVSSRFSGVGAASPTTVRLLPIEPGAHNGRRRARYVAEESFANAVIREYLYVTIYGLLLDALASEHGARLAAAEAATTWLESRTERLRRQLLATRREASTQETIETAAGARGRSVRR